MTEAAPDFLASLLDAAAYAIERHGLDRRKNADPIPYSVHPVRVARELARAGVGDRATLEAALLHDTLEDTDTSAEELEESFGPEVRRIVEEVSDDKSLPKARRKQLQVETAPLLSAPAKLVRVADKICNIEDVTTNPPPDWPLERRREYVAWAARVVDGCRGVNPALEARFDGILQRARASLDRNGS